MKVTLTQLSETVMKDSRPKKDPLKEHLLPNSTVPLIYIFQNNKKLVTSI